MCTQQFVIRRRDRLAPFPFRMPVLYQRHRTRDSVGAFRMARRGVLGATRIVENDHLVSGILERRSDCCRTATWQPTQGAREGRPLWYNEISLRIASAASRLRCSWANCRARREVSSALLKLLLFA